MWVPPGMCSTLKKQYQKIVSYPIQMIFTSDIKTMENVFNLQCPLYSLDEQFIFSQSQNNANYGKNVLEGQIHEDIQMKNKQIGDDCMSKSDRDGLPKMRRGLISEISTLAPSEFQIEWP